MLQMKIEATLNRRYARVVRRLAVLLGIETTRATHAQLSHWCAQELAIRTPRTAELSARFNLPTA